MTWNTVTFMTCLLYTSHVIQRLFQFPGRLVFTAFLQSFRNVAETGCMQLAFQLGNG